MTKIKNTPNTKLINCVVLLEDGTKTHVVDVTKTGYKVAARTKQVPMKHMRAKKNTLVEDTTDVASEIVDGLRVNLNKRQAAGKQEIEAPVLDTVRRYIDPTQAETPKRKEKAPKEKAQVKTKDLELRVSRLEALLEQYKYSLAGKAEQEDKAPHYKFLVPSKIKNLYKTKLTIPHAAKAVMAKALGLESNQIQRGLMVNDRRNGLVTFVGYDKEELLFIFMDSKDKAVALSATDVAASKFTLASDIELDRA